MRDAGYDAAFHGQKSYNGVAILAKQELRDVQVGLCDETEDPQARVIAATAGDLRIYSIYAPNGQAVGSPAYEYKLAWYARLTNCLHSAEDKAARLIVGGDFNVAPNDEDVHDPILWRGAIMCSEGERAAFRELCEVGLSDTLRLHHRGPGIFSWWDYRMLSFAVYGSMPFWPGATWPKDAARPESIAKCAKARNHPITRRSGRTLRSEVC